MMTEAYGLSKVNELGKYYGNSKGIQDQIGPLSHMPLFFEMITNFKPGTEITADLVIISLRRTLEPVMHITVPDLIMTVTYQTSIFVLRLKVPSKDIKKDFPWTMKRK